jgi:hypothetical protein
MKPIRLVLILAAVISPFVLKFRWEHYRAVKGQEEALRMMKAETKLVEKLEAYQQANGHYPDSFRELSFTNSAQETQMLPDVQKLVYRKSKSGGYTLSYEGVSGYRSSFSSSVSGGPVEK